MKDPNPVIIINHTEQGTDENGNRHRIGILVSQTKNSDGTTTVFFLPDDVYCDKRNSWNGERDEHYKKIANTPVKVIISTSGCHPLPRHTYSDDRDFLILDDGEFNIIVNKKDSGEKLAWIKQITTENIALQEEINRLNKSIEKLKQEMTFDDTVEELVEKRHKQVKALMQGVEEAKRGSNNPRLTPPNPKEEEE